MHTWPCQRKTKAGSCTIERVHCLIIYKSQSFINWSGIAIWRQPMWTPNTRAIMLCISQYGSPEGELWWDHLWLGKIWLSEYLTSTAKPLSQTYPNFNVHHTICILMLELFLKVVLPKHTRLEYSWWSAKSLSKMIYMLFVHSLRININWWICNHYLFM